jgi:hypothetical protein
MRKARRIAGSGSSYADQAELGVCLLGQFGEGDTEEPVAPAEAVDRNALTAQVTANYEATGSWYL